MGIRSYGKIEQFKTKKIKKRIKALCVAAVIVTACAAAIGVLVGDSEEYIHRSTILQENHDLKERVMELETQLEELQNELAKKDEYIAAIPTEAPSEEVPDGGGWNMESPRQE